MAISWTYKMTTGIAAIDEQHRTLIRAVNLLSRRLGDGDNPLQQRELGGVLGWLETYARHHFRAEEHCMNALSCPTAAANRVAHQDFQQHLSQFQLRHANATEAPTQIGLALEAFLSSWLLEHLCGVDAALSQCAAGSGGGAGTPPGAFEDADLPT